MIANAKIEAKSQRLPLSATSWREDVILVFSRPLYLHHGTAYRVRYAHITPPLPPQLDCLQTTLKS
jgi:hypothetical protein